MKHGILEIKNYLQWTKLKYQFHALPVSCNIPPDPTNHKSAKRVISVYINLRAKTNILSDKQGQLQFKLPIYSYIKWSIN